MSKSESTPESFPVLQKTIMHIQDAFRDERKKNASILLNAHRIKELVDNGRYDFHTACKLLKTSSLEVKTALLWMIEDNARLNSAYDTQVHAQPAMDYITAGWFHDQEGSKVVKISKAG